MTTDRHLLDDFLAQHDERAWEAALEALAPSIHDVDRTAARIWFAFHPLPLARLLEDTDDADLLAKILYLEGRFRLEDGIDRSHRFLYGHRYWPEVKQSVAHYASLVETPPAVELAALVRELARRTAGAAHVDPSLTVGITAVALMTVQQVGLRAFLATPGAVLLDPRVASRSPQEVLRARARDDRQGIKAFLTGLKQWTITFDENDPAATFPLIEGQALTTAAANDKRDYRAREPRCFPGEGPIPVQCRTAACGTCWVGVLGGGSRLSEVEPLERQRLREFGYADTTEPRPIIRLACQAQAHGAVSIVIPEWNGQLGRYLRAQEAAEDSEPTAAGRAGH